jgi:hypothetical protein
VVWDVGFAHYDEAETWFFGFGGWVVVCGVGGCSVQVVADDLLRTRYYSLNVIEMMEGNAWLAGWSR